MTYLPFPLVNLNSGWQKWEQDVYIAPEAFDIASKEFAPFIDQWQTMAGYNFTKVYPFFLTYIDKTNLLFIYFP